MQTDLQKPRRVMGIDPGFGSCGIAILEVAQGVPPIALKLKVIKTQKIAKKLRTNLRASTDDMRRYSEIQKQLESVRREFVPSIAGVEAYMVFQARGGNAWKSAVVYGGVVMWALTQGLYVAPFLPADLKKRFTGQRSASKDDVAKQIGAEIVNFNNLLAAIPKTQREHASDAAGQALLAYEDAEEQRRQLGW